MIRNLPGTCLTQNERASILSIVYVRGGSLIHVTHVTSKLKNSKLSLQMCLYLRSWSLLEALATCTHMHISILLGWVCNQDNQGALPDELRHGALN